MVIYNIEEIYYINEKKLFLKGWIVNNNNSDIKVTINGTDIHNIYIQKKRDDVFSEYKTIIDTNILGFETIIHSNNAIESISLDLYNNSKKIENIKVYDIKELINLEKDKNNIIYNVEDILLEKDKIIIKGWAFSKYNESVNIVVKGSTLLKIKKYDRADVREAYNNFKIHDNCGFEIIIKRRLLLKKLYIGFYDNYNKIEYEINKKLYIKKYINLRNIIRSLNYSNFKKGIFHIKKYGYKSLFNKIVICENNNLNYTEWIKDNDIKVDELNYQRKYKFDYNPLISVIIPTYNTPGELLHQTIESVINQTYDNWELCIADGGSKDETIKVLRYYETQNNKIKINYLKENKGISENSNEAIKIAKGEYITLFDHDDIIHANALFEVVKSINENKELDIIYTDEDKIDENNNRKTPFFKPDWSPDLLNSQMYICHMLTFKKSLFDKVGGFRKDYDGSQDYDLMLRMSLETDKIHHIPKVLYSWRELSTSTSINPDSKPYAHIAGLNALNDYLKIKYKGNAYAEQTENLYVYDTRFKINRDIKVSIIIPTKDKVDLMKQCINSIEEKTTYKNYEILIMNNNSIETETYLWFEEIQKNKSNIRVIDAKYDFNWSKLNNHGIKEARGDVFVFLNNDTMIISEDWLERLAENAIREEIGTVGALLLYEDNTIQHSGVVLGMGGWADHVYKGIIPVHIGSPYVSPVINRNVLASTGACLAISRKTIEKIGDFDENFIICGSDVEISLRAREYGLYNLLNARVKLYHLESKSRDSFIPEIDFKMSEKHYRKYLNNGDPYYNPNLDLNSTMPVN